jgi:ATP-binding cassette, subfamily B, bacterial
MIATIRALWAMMRGQRLRYGLAILALFLSVVVGFVGPLVGQVVIDHVLISTGGEAEPWLLRLLGGRDFLGSNLWIAGLAAVLLTVAGGILGYWKTQGTVQASDSIARNLKNELYDQLQHLPARYFDKAAAGDLVQRCTSDVETVRGFFAGQVVEIGHAGILLASVIPLMLFLSVPMTIISFLLVPMIVGMAAFFFVRIRGSFQAVAEAEGKMTAVIQENLTGMRVVKAFARQQFEEGKFAEPNLRYRDSSRRLTGLMALYWPASDFLCMAQNGIVLICGIHWISEGTLTVGTLFAFLVYLNMMLWPMRQIGRVLTDLGKAQVALRRIREILGEPREVGVRTAPEAVEPSSLIRGEISVEGLCFAHPDAPAVLQEISFSVGAGETLAIVGPSGAGKSTIAQLLLRFYDYECGSMRLDGRELREMDRKTVRRHIRSVLQEPFLFSTTLRDNIRLGCPEAEDEEVFQAARMAALHETISGFHRGYDTHVGERGVNLSGGQRQRIALARAILRDPPVLLLDDALSAVDGETESLVLKALESRRGRKTTIIIAHRLSTLSHADKVLVLDGGRIIQSGTHENLIREDGLYRRLWQIQSDAENEFLREAEAAPFQPGGGFPVHADGEQL